jgi:hypothetical protein
MIRMAGKADCRNSTEPSLDALSATMISASSLLWLIREGRNFSRNLFPFQFSITTATFTSRDVGEVPE